MDDWQQRFVQKVDLVRKTSRDQFEQVADTVLLPVFEEFREFTSRQGFCATAPVAKPGVRAFKFALKENAYLFVTFRMAGFEHGELQAEFFTPAQSETSSTPVHVEMTDLNAGWARRMFEQLLDQFLDRFVGTLADQDGSIPELIEG